MAGTFVYMANPSNIPEISVKVISLFLASVLIIPGFFVSDIAVIIIRNGGVFVVLPQIDSE